MMVGRKDTNDWVTGQPGNPQKAVEDGRRRAFIGRLSDYL
jgi:hypothetical protein